MNLPLEERRQRLEALLAFASSADADEQVRQVLEDAREALQCAHVEFVVEDRNAVTRVCVVGEFQNIEYPAAAPHSRCLMVFDAQKDLHWSENPLIAAGVRSLLLWPAQFSARNGGLVFGWRRKRESFISEDEIQYVEYVARILGHLLESADKQEDLRQRLSTDPLTELRNRTAAFEELAAAVSQAARSGMRAAVLYVDLDDFKIVNDTHGHAFGDFVLSEVARRMRAGLRKHEIAGRMGGDEFSIIVKDVQSEAELAALARRIIRDLSQPITVAGVRLELSGSIGIAVYPADGREPAVLMRSADEAMYRAKKRGGKDFEFFSQGEQAPPDDFSIRLSAPQIEREFMLCYQPIVDIRSDQVIAAEALLRWLHPDLGLLLPSSFLKAALEHRALGHLEHWAINTITGKAHPFAALHRNFAAHVNVSAPDPELIEMASRSATISIALELRESDVAGNFPQWFDFATRCKQSGIRVGLADFGCAGLSLRQLSELPIDFVKIPAKTLLETVGSRPAMHPRTLVEQAHRMRCTVIAEALHDLTAREWLAAQGVDAIQGFAVSSPLTDMDFTNWLQSRAAV